MPQTCLGGIGDNVGELLEDPSPQVSHLRTIRGYRAWVKAIHKGLNVSPQHPHLLVHGPFLNVEKLHE